MNQLQIFNNEKFGNLEIYIDENGKVWFPATEVAEMLGYKNPHKAILDHCKEHGVTFREVIANTGFGDSKQKKKYIDEGNVFRLLTKSHIPGAEEFESWIFDYIVPSVMKTGSYNAPAMSIEDMIIANATEMKIVKGDIAELKHKVENKITLDSGEQRKVTKEVGKRVYERSEKTGVPVKILFQALYRDLKDIFGVASYKDIKQKDLEDALKCIKNWIEVAEIRENAYAS